jgi:hypothetical protein
MREDSRKQLPLWVDDRDAEHPEAGVCRRMTPDQRGERMIQCCRLAMVILRGRDDPEVALAFRDPLPASSMELLERLRRRYSRAA